MMTLCPHIIMKSTHALHIFHFMQFKRLQWLGVVLASATREVEHSSCIADNTSEQAKLVLDCELCWKETLS